MLGCYLSLNVIHYMIRCHYPLVFLAYFVVLYSNDGVICLLQSKKKSFSSSQLYFLYITGKQSTHRNLPLVLEPEFLGESELVEGGIAGELHHGRRPAHQDDVILPRREQVLRDHVGVHEAKSYRHSEFNHYVANNPIAGRCGCVDRVIIDLITTPK